MSLDEEDARRRDAADPGHRELFHVPPAEGGRYAEVAYLAGNSLGLQPRATRAELLEDLDAWAHLGVEGHLDAKRPWLPYHELLTEPAARLVGALPRETVIMNSLTVNLHLLMVSFYRPRPGRDRIVIEDTTFPSDSYTVRSQARFHGLDPDSAVVRLETGKVREYLERDGESVALVLPGGVSYLTGDCWTSRRSPRSARPRVPSSGGTWPTPPGTSRCACTTGASTSPRGAPKDTSTPAPARSPKAFIRSGTYKDAAPQRFEGWWSTDAASRFRMAQSRRRRPRRTRGRSPTRRSSRWARSAPRWRSSTG